MTDLPPHYAESVALVGFDIDGSREISVRMARFPDQDRAELWLFVRAPGEIWSTADPHLTLAGERGATPVRSASARFALGGSSNAVFDSSDRDGEALRGRVNITALTDASAHPEPRAGHSPVRVTAEFTASHRPVSVRAGRLEVMGHVSADVETINGRWRLDAPGKWHEQVGPRAQFADAFTYFNVQNEHISLLASTRAAGAWGYLHRGGQTTVVTAMTIDGYGKPERAFVITLANGETVTGHARVVYETSVPIEGRRRPGALVIAQTNLGRLVGHLNDWQPG